MTGSLIVIAVVAFAGTAIDDLIILTALFMARATTGRPGAGVIVAGQYAGFVAILSLSLAAAAGLRIVPDRWVGLLGLVPIGLGVWGLWRLRGSDEDTRQPLAGTVARIGAVTFANGADNIGVFTPLLRILHTTGALTVTVLYLTLVSVWCAAGALLGGHRTVVAALGRVAHWLVPVVFIAVGALILVTSGIFTPVVRAV